jgi:hypothetical protein
MLSLTYITTLYALCVSVVGFTGVYVLKSNPKSPSNQAYFAFSVANIVWMIALFIGGYFAPIGGEVIDADKALFFFRIAWATPGLMLPALFFFFYLYPKEIKPLPNIFKYLVFFASLLFLGISITPLIHKGLIIENGIYIADSFGKLYLPYFIIFQGSLLGIFALALFKLRKTKGIENKKLIIATTGFAFFEFFPLTTNVLLPIFDVYVFQNEAVVFTLFFSIPTFYSIIRYRFLDIKLIVSKTVKRFIAIGVSFIFGLLIYKGITALLPKTDVEYLYIIIFLLIILIYTQTRNLLNISKFHKFFGIASLENFQKTVEKLRDKNSVYDSLGSFEKDIRKTFCKQLHISFAKIVLINEKTQNDYPHLINNFKKK